MKALTTLLIVATLILGLAPGVSSQELPQVSDPSLIDSVFAPPVTQGQAFEVGPCGPEGSIMCNDNYDCFGWCRPMACPRCINNCCSCPLECAAP